MPATVAPVFTVTAVSPAAPTIALSVPVPTDAPLLSVTVTSLPLCTSVLMAAEPLSELPVTDPDTAMEVAPLPSWSTNMPSPPLPVTTPVTLIEIVPAPVFLARIPVPLVDVIAPPVADCVRAMPPAPD